MNCRFAYKLIFSDEAHPEKRSISSIASESDLVEVDGCVRPPPVVMSSNAVTLSKASTSPDAMTSSPQSSPISSKHSPPPLKPTSPPTTEGSFDC